MKKMRYQQLSDHLLRHLPESYHANFYAWMEKGKLRNEGRQVTDSGVEIAQLDYEAVFFFDKLPFRTINPYKLLALVQVWLNEHGEYNRDFESDVNIEMIDDNTAELDITLQFSEPITAERDDEGDLVIDGERYRFDEIDVQTVDVIDIALRAQRP